MPLTANAAQYQAVQWGYVMYCALNTLDWPCSSSVIGTAIISSGAPSVATSGCAYVNCGLPYYTMLGFIGVRTYTNRYGQKTVSNVSLSQVGEDYGDQLLYLQQPFTDGDGITYRLNGTDGALTQVPGGLLGNEANVYLDPWPVETIAIAPGGPSNALNFDPSLTVFCSTAPGFVSSAYNASSYGAAGSSSMSACIGSFPTVSRPSAATTATGLRTFSLQYAIGDGASYLASVSGTLYTDGSVGTDALGNTYYNLIAITGTRTYTSLLTNTTTVTNITSLMAQNIVPTSNRPDITNNNRLYPQYPYFDRYGIAYTVSANVAADGSTTPLTTIVGLLVYREDTPEEYFRLLSESYPVTNLANALQPLNVTQIANPASYALVQWCYVMYGLNGTLDYPWSSVVSGTALINAASVLSTSSVFGYSLPAQSYYPMLGFVGTRNFTNRYGSSSINSITLNAIGEDHAVNQLWLQSPYAGGISFHLNATIETQGGLPATDFEVFLDPFPIEGTAYGYGVGGGSNALNNDPSMTLFASTAAGFQTSSYSNAPVSAINSSSVGSVQGSTSIAQCVAYFPIAAKSPPAAGLQVFALQYTLQGGNSSSPLAYTVSASFQLITDGTVQYDALGNAYFTVAAISGVRNMTWLATGQVTSNALSALLPVCSGPSVSNIDSVYCNSNRLFPQYPYVDRLGLRMSSLLSPLSPAPTRPARASAVCMSIVRPPSRRPTRRRAATRPGLRRLRRRWRWCR